MFKVLSANIRKFTAAITVVILLLGQFYVSGFIRRAEAADPAFVRSAANAEFSVSSEAATFSGSVTSGNVIAVFVYWLSTTNTLTSITDNCGGSYTIVDNPTTGSSGRAAMAYGTGSSGSCTVTAQFSGSNNVALVMVHEISGVDTTLPLDNNRHALHYQTNPGTGTDAITSGIINTTVNGDYIFGATVSENCSSGDFVAGTGYTGRAAITAAGGCNALTEDRIQASAGDIAATFTNTNAGAYPNLLTGIMAFKPAGGSQSDTEAPTVPTNLSATPASSSAINLSWTASTDSGGSGLAGYQVFRCTGSSCTPISQIATSTTNSYSNSGLDPSTAYTYAVSAFDNSLNISAASDTASATTRDQVAAGYLIDSSRSIDWSQAGIPGGIPNRTTQCGATIEPYNGSAATINTAIDNCPEGQYVSLGEGTFNLSNGIDFGLNNNVTLRGQGADKTLLVFSAPASRNGLTGAIYLAGSNSAQGNEDHTADWTAGYAKGSTQITLSNSLGIVPNSTLINLDQLDEDQDTGNIWNCLVNGVCSNGGTAGQARNGNRSQEQQVMVTACSPSCNNAGSTVVTITPGLYMSNWRSAQSPGAWWANTTITGDGIENLSADVTSATGANTVLIMNCYECWVKGIRSIMASRNHVWVYQSSHSVVRDSYFYQGQSHGSVSYGIEVSPASSDNLIENNITQQVTDSTPTNNGGGAGNVAAYNFAINDVYNAAGWMQPSDYEHASGMDFWLREGNVGVGFISDNVHGTHHFTTLFRNYYKGWQADCGGSACTAQTIPIHLYAASRYFNIIGNVLGQPGYHNNYNCIGSGSPCANAATSIYTLGFTGNNGGVDANLAYFCSDESCTASNLDYDPLTTATLFRWGNYDTVSAAVKWDNSEVPSNLTLYTNEVPQDHTLAASLYLSSKPSWWPAAKPWPVIGPDVTGGNITGLAGYAYTNPAQDCFLNTMGGPADGSGSVLTFNADTCYNSSAPSTDTRIISFTFASPAATGVVNNTNHTVAVTVPYGTNVTSLIPTITLATGATISPTSGTARNFTNPVIYRVTAEDGTTQQDYTVTVTAVSGYTIGGSISGLVGSVTLQNNGADSLTRTSNGSFTFNTPLAGGAAYAVTVSAQPSGMTCSVSGGSGNVASANITNISVVCSTNYTGGGGGGGAGYWQTSTPTPTPSPTPTAGPVIIPTLPANPTIADYQNLLNALIKQLAYLQGLVANQQAGIVPASTGTGYKFTVGLGLGDSGEGVRQLQLFLKAQGSEIYPEGFVTGYFGILTQKAVQRFQEKYGIAKLGDLGYGYVGPLTRAKLNALQGL